MVIVEGMGSPRGAVPGLIGNTLGQTTTISQQEIATSLISRGYTKSVAAPVSPSVSPTVRVTTPTITRAGAIKKALDYYLSAYGYALRCTRIGGCAISEARFNQIIAGAAGLATRYLQAGSIQTRTPSISPAYSPSPSPAPVWTRLSGQPVLNGLSTRLSGIGGELYNMGQNIAVNPPTLPGWQPGADQPGVADPGGLSFWEWVTVVSSAAGAGANAYFTAKAERDRIGQTATLTAQQIKAVVNEAIIQNPSLNRQALVSAAAGASGKDEPKETPAWVMPLVMGTAVVAFMSLGKGKRF